MKISYTTKEESKKIQKEEFLKLSGAERLMEFFRISTLVKRLPRSKDIPKSEKKNNLVIQMPIKK